MTVRMTAFHGRFCAELTSLSNCIFSTGRAVVPFSMMPKAALLYAQGIAVKCALELRGRRKLGGLLWWMWQVSRQANIVVARLDRRHGLKPQHLSIRYTAPTSSFGRDQQSYASKREKMEGN